MIKGINGGGDCSEIKATIEAKRDIPRILRRNPLDIALPVTIRHEALETRAPFSYRLVGSPKYTVVQTDLSMRSTWVDYESLRSQ